MNYFKITYTINDKNERVYPKKMKGVVFTGTQDHASEHVMIAATEAKMEEDGKSIVALTAKDAEALVKEFQETFPKAASLPPGVPPPPPPVPAPEQ
jgi:hypothetical protein